MTTWQVSVFPETSPTCLRSLAEVSDKSVTTWQVSVFPETSPTCLRSLAKVSNKSVTTWQVSVFPRDVSDMSEKSRRSLRQVCDNVTSQCLPPRRLRHVWEVLQKSQASLWQLDKLVSSPRRLRHAWEVSQKSQTSLWQRDKSVSSPRRLRHVWEVLQKSQTSLWQRDKSVSSPTSQKLLGDVSDVSEILRKFQGSRGRLWKVCVMEFCPKQK